MNPFPPKPFCVNPAKIKAFVLGCDPTAFDKNQNRLEFEYVFDLGKDQRYFAGVLKNLEWIGLSINDIYVQNLIADYQENETGKNNEWKQMANEYLPLRIEELNKIDPIRKIPVFLTAYNLYELLVNEDLKRFNAQHIYNLEIAVPVKPENNVLGRPLVPLFRHRSYDLMNWENYVSQIKQLF